MSGGIDHARIDKLRTLIAEGLSAAQIAEVIGGSRHSVIGLAWRHKLGPWPVRPESEKDTLVNIPEDFPRLFAERNRKELCFIYSRSNATISKWALKLGLRKKPQPRPRLSRVVASPYRPRAAKFDRPVLVPLSRAFRPHKDLTPAGQAADYLRRFGPVIRCNERGEYDQYGTLWLRGHTILTADDVIERAERNGWGRIAA